jgi:hypothetical protein
MQRVISFSLYGNSPKYLQGALENIELAKVYYPGWKCWFYCASTIPPEFFYKLIEVADKVISMPEAPEGKMRGWRFLAAGSPDVDAAIFRDADSRLNQRGAAATQAWIDSDLPLHVMRDHEHHCCHKIYGGMWGLRAGAVPNMAQEIEAFPHWEGTSDWRSQITDMAFTELVIWPKFKASQIMHHADTERAALAYDRYEGCVAFPPHAPYEGYVGEVCE